MIGWAFLLAFWAQGDPKPPDDRGICLTQEEVVLVRYLSDRWRVVQSGDSTYLVADSTVVIRYDPDGGPVLYLQYLDLADSLLVGTP